MYFSPAFDRANIDIDDFLALRCRRSSRRAARSPVHADQRGDAPSETVLRTISSPSSSFAILPIGISYQLMSLRRRSSGIFHRVVEHDEATGRISSMCS